MNRKLSDDPSLVEAVYASLLTLAPGNNDRPIRVFCSEAERDTESYKTAVRQLEARGLKVAVFADHVNIFREKRRFASAAEKKAWRSAHWRGPVN